MEELVFNTQKEIVIEKEFSVKEYQKAYRSIEMKEAKRDFVIHAIIYVLINAGLIALNLFADRGGVIWFYWPLIGWGFGLLMHLIFGVLMVEREFETKEALAEKLARDQKFE